MSSRPPDLVDASLRSSIKRRRYYIDARTILARTVAGNSLQVDLHENVL